MLREIVPLRSVDEAEEFIEVVVTVIFKESFLVDVQKKQTGTESVDPDVKRQFVSLNEA